MTNLNFNDGFKTITINNDPDRVISWNPSDINFVDRFLAFQNWVKNEFKPKIEAIKISDSGNNLAEYDEGQFTKIGKEMEGAINKAFGRDVATPAFLGVNPISPVDNGNLLFANFLEALTPFIESSIADFDKERKKYTNAATKLKRK